MALGRPDPRFTHSKKAQANFRLALKISFVVVAALWLVFLIDAMLGLRLGRFGLRPGSVAGLWGIISAPLLHGSLNHIFSNSMPLFVSLTAILYLYPNSSSRVIPLIWLGSGILAWIIGRPSLHYGASGLIYGLLAYVFVSGILRRDMRSISVSMLVGFLYGSMVWGVLPIRPNMSWELHLGGAVMGVVLAIVYSKWDRIPVLRYDWEDDDTPPEWYPEASDSDVDLPDQRH
jgi:membrane associated rhomboid family serine protease